jgi:hypothetical protein
MKIKSKESAVNASPEQVFQFLSDCNNIIHLLPEDKISDWKATPDSCSFKVQKMATIPLVIELREPYHLIAMKSGDGAPFPFILNIRISEDGSNSIGYIEFEGQVNAFLKMMVEKPLIHLFDYMSLQLRSRFEQ